MLPSSDVHGRGPLSRPTPLLLQHGLLTTSSCAAELTGSLMLQLLAGSTLSPTHIAAVYAGLSACFSQACMHANAPSAMSASVCARALDSCAPAPLHTQWLVSPTTAAGTSTPL